jgi:hypothetical protein
VTGRNFAAIAEQLRGGGFVFVVDAAGAVHQVALDHYLDLTAEQLRGSRIFTQPADAERFAERIRSKRN